MEDEGARAAIRDLSAETLALQFILVHVLNRVAGTSQEASQTIVTAFDEAANGLESFCISLGKDSAHGVTALKVVEDLRAMVLGRNNKPRQAV